MSITKRGLLWEIANSYYMLFPFTMILCGLGIFIAGKRTRVSKWKKQGLIYLAIFWTLFTLFDMFGEEVKNFLGIALLMVLVMCMVTSFTIRKEYLIRLELLKDGARVEFEDNKLRNQIKNEYNLAKSNREEAIDINKQENNEGFKEENEVIKDISLKRKPTIKRTIEKKEQNITLIDINQCSQDEFEKLPGFTIITAKKAIRIREEKNGFKKIDEFIKDLDVKEYHIEKIKSLVKCEEKEDQNKVKTTGRMVDF